MTVQKPVCLKCKHYNLNDFSKPSCLAFEKIPNLIWLKGEEHSKPLPEQKNEIVFQPIEPNK